MAGVLCFKGMWFSGLIILSLWNDNDDGGGI